MVSYMYTQKDKEIKHMETMTMNLEDRKIREIQKSMKKCSLIRRKIKSKKVWNHLDASRKEMENQTQRRGL